MAVTDIKRRVRDSAKLLRELADENEELRAQQPAQLLEEITLLREMVRDRDAALERCKSRELALYAVNRVAPVLFPILVQLNEDGMMTTGVLARLFAVPEWHELLLQYEIRDGKACLKG